MRKIFLIIGYLMPLGVFGTVVWYMLELPPTESNLPVVIGVFAGCGCLMVVMVSVLSISDKLRNYAEKRRWVSKRENNQID